MIETFRTFKSACMNAGVDLHDDLVAMAENANGTRDYAPFESSRFFAAIAGASRVLRKFPGEELATDCIDSFQFRDLPARILATMINDSLAPSGVRHDSRNFKTAEPLTAIAACSEADWHFSAILDGLSKEMPVDCQVFTDGDTPVLIRKGLARGKPSALTLENISVNGVRLIRGFLVRVETHGDRMTDNNEPCVMPYGTEVLPLEAISAIAPLRIAGIALPTDQRQAYLPHELVKSFFDIEDARNIVAEALYGPGS